MLQPSYQGRAALGVDRAGIVRGVKEGRIGEAGGESRIDRLDIEHADRDGLGRTGRQVAVECHIVDQRREQRHITGVVAVGNDVGKHQLSPDRGRAGHIHAGAAVREVGCRRQHRVVQEAPRGRLEASYGALTPVLNQRTVGKCRPGQKIQRSFGIPLDSVAACER